MSRGGVDYEAAGERFHLRFSTNVLCGIEEDCARSISALVADLETNQPIRLVRMFLTAGTTPEITSEKAGDIIDEVGLIRAIEIVGRALTFAFDNRAETTPKKRKPRS